MALDKSCPGSRSIREPVPDYIKCPGCGADVEIWTDELKATCRCGNKVYRAQQTSCIEWCPHARECVGPEVYERLRPGVPEEVSAADSPLSIFEREHSRALEILRLLRGAGLCLKLGTLQRGENVRERGLGHMDKVLEFFEKDLRLHFRREEEVLFPAMERHIGAEKSPTRMMLKEHAQMWRYYDELRVNLDDLRKAANGESEAFALAAQNTSSRIEELLREHIRKENESLLPLARTLLKGDELEAVAGRLRTLG